MLSETLIVSGLLTFTSVMIQFFLQLAVGVTAAAPTYLAPEDSFDIIYCPINQVTPVPPGSILTMNDKKQ